MSEGLLQDYLTKIEHSPEPISKLQELTKRMARLAHMIRDIIIDAFQQKEASDNLQDLYSSFQEVLLPDLKASEFADMVPPRYLVDAQRTPFRSRTAGFLDI
jgi:hypothetical protein